MTSTRFFPTKLVRTFIELVRLETRKGELGEPCRGALVSGWAWSTLGFSTGCVFELGWGKGLRPFKTLLAGDLGEFVAWSAWGSAVFPEMPAKVFDCDSLCLFTAWDCVLVKCVSKEDLKSDACAVHTRTHKTTCVWKNLIAVEPRVEGLLANSKYDMAQS